jgi:hypothetical protein
MAYCLPLEHREAVLGDLEEGYMLARDRARPVARCGVTGASRWYWGQVVRSIWPALTLQMDRPNLGKLLGAVLVGFATMWIVGDVVLVGSRAAYAALFPADPSPDTVLRITYLASMLPTCLLAGYLAARSGGPVGRLAALTLGVLLVLPVLIAPFLQHGGDPLWARMVWVIGGPAATLYGANRRGARGAF